MDFWWRMSLASLICSVFDFFLRFRILKSAWLLQVTRGLAYDTLQDDFKGNNNNNTETFQYLYKYWIWRRCRRDWHVYPIIFFFSSLTIKLYLLFICTLHIYLKMSMNMSYYNVGTYFSTGSAQFEWTLFCHIYCNVFYYFSTCARGAYYYINIEVYSKFLYISIDSVHSNDFQ